MYFDNERYVCIQCDNRMNLHENTLFNLNIHDCWAFIVYNEFLHDI
jgi:hypothetical protein